MNSAAETTSKRQHENQPDEPDTLLGHKLNCPEKPDDGQIQFFGEHARLADADAFTAFLSPLRRCEWVVYAKKPFGGPEQVLAYLSRYTHRVAISNRRLVSANATAVTFKYKDYRVDGFERFKTMTLATGEFIRRFLIHVLPKGFHRIRHYGMLANGQRAENIAKARELLEVPMGQSEPQPEGEALEAAEEDAPRIHPRPCPCCGGRMLVIEVFEGGQMPQQRRAAIVIRIDTS